ncbi:hypothetical protein [Paenibacillus durus]|uniref:Uncharacterized protein n=1 Tax=Paenibacillus durus ATCC 35681 TaxID=1333534 RepID=A0A0F7CJZ2_PAEDU|nr:hypothetical protein [Paenibacillus durus]AKG36756.1 hypothetical protein VK70_21400 [Paenibacillus durus ATCC 35681]
MLNKFKTFKYPVVIAIGCAILIWGMTTYVQKQKEQGAIVYRVESHADRALAVDVEGLVNHSDYIVMGHYDKFEKKWEVSADPYTEGDIYNFVVDEIILGEVPQNIPVGIPHYKRVATQIEGKTYSADFTEPNYINPNFDSKYILFLKKYEPLNLYTPASVPYHIEIDSNNKIALKYSNGDDPKQVKINNDEIIEFKPDSYDLSKLDKITGKSVDELKTSLKDTVKKLK